ncbi:MAG TPA: hypothetical protein VFW77_01720 [Candidatus Saccharimonadales bacterium]|nr:hypothetical protein [Candidatus Saccharimonadales bacterium]
MNNEQTKTNLNFATVEDDLPLTKIWHRVMNELFASISLFSLIMFMFFVAMIFFAGILVASNGGVVYIILGLVCILIFIAVLVLKTAKKTREQLRAADFATANGFYFLREQKDPGFAGVIFSLGDTRRATCMIEGNYGKREFKIFNYSYMQGSGKNRSEYDKGVIMIKLPRRLPNVVFDSKANNHFGISTLGTTFKSSEKFTLEGDFNKHFDVYAPQNYGLDVLYFITPELMALMVDEASNYDIEVVDDNLFFYAPAFEFTKSQLANIFKLIRNIGGEFSENTELYADERVGNRAMDYVSEPGRRLKRGVSWLSIAGIIIYLAIRILIEIVDNR